MKIMTYDTFQLDQQTETLDKFKKIDETVLDIIATVKSNGDNALFDYAKKFEQVELNHLVVEDAEFTEAEKLVSEAFKYAVGKASMNIREFHEKQLEQSWFFHKENGITLGQQVTPM